MTNTFVLLTNEKGLAMSRFTISGGFVVRWLATRKSFINPKALSHVTDNIMCEYVYVCPSKIGLHNYPVNTDAVST